MEFTEQELELLKYALVEIVGWLDTDEDFKNLNSICGKLNINLND